MRKLRPAAVSAALTATAIGLGLIAAAPASPAAAAPARVAAIPVNGPNGLVSADFNDEPDNGRAELLGRRTDGTVWLYGNTTGTTSLPYADLPIKVDSGWQPYNWFLAGDVTGDHYADALVETSDGVLTMFPNSENPATPFTINPRVVGTSWQQFTHIALGDVTHDPLHTADLVAEKPDGTLWLYPSSGGYSTPFDQGSYKIGTGWQGYNRILVADVTGDHWADILATKPDGTLWLYVNKEDPGNPYAGETGKKIGTGWQEFNRLTANDVDGDGLADIVATKPDGTLWLYLSKGSADAPFDKPGGQKVGSGWQNFG